MLYAVLNFLYCDLTVFYLILKIRCHSQRQQIQNILIHCLFCGRKSLLHRGADLRQHKLRDFPVPFNHLYHILFWISCPLQKAAATFQYSTFPSIVN